MEPFEALRDELQWWRDGDQWHRGGVAFGEAWEQALARVCRGREARFWRATFEEQRPVWRRAYLRMEPTAGDQFAPAGFGLVSIRERLCGYCGEPIPDECRPEALFCSAKHRTAFHNQAKKTALQSQIHASGEARADLSGEPFDMFIPT